MPCAGNRTTPAYCLLEPLLRPSITCFLLFVHLTVIPGASGEFLGMKKEIKLEPLIGHQRHPYGLGSCVPDGEQVCYYLPIKSCETAK